MSWRLVEGVPLPDAVGGHPALDFCNTRAGWGDPRPKEYLTGPSVLALWARKNNLIPAATLAGTTLPGAALPGAALPGAALPPPGDPRDSEPLARSLALREALYACSLRRGSPADWELVSAEAARARLFGRLVPGRGEEPAAWQPADGVSPAAAALAAVAVAAEDLLTSSLAAFVAACPGEGCGWLFADRRRKRRWCSMAACGNRAKARRYAERRQATAVAPTESPAVISAQL
jgi:CGNR zinc finger protein/putative stress-induced transcription regulator